jgi:hypothetical protein
MMNGSKKLIILVLIALGAAAISGCTRFNLSRRSAPPDGRIGNDPAEHVLFELEGTLIDLEDVLASSEQWSLDPP